MYEWQIMKLCTYVCITFAVMHFAKFSTSIILYTGKEGIQLHMYEWINVYIVILEVCTYVNFMVT